LLQRRSNIQVYWFWISLQLQFWVFGIYLPRRECKMFFRSLFSFKNQGILRVCIGLASIIQTHYRSKCDQISCFIFAETSRSPWKWCDVASLALRCSLCTATSGIEQGSLTLVSHPDGALNSSPSKYVWNAHLLPQFRLLALAYLSSPPPQSPHWEKYERLVHSCPHQ
jgi:hypothetical protein